MDWIAVDWGTSNLRAWAMWRGHDEPLDHAQSDAGMAGLARDGFEPALLALIEPWLAGAVGPVPVIACGMVGARQGWIEAPYASAPCPALAAPLTRAPTADPRLAVWITNGVSQSIPDDVMRGEETQIAGVMAAIPAFDGVICLPGTHCKWARVAAGQIIEFRTFMTGEVFALLASQSVLRHSVESEAWDTAAFAEAVGEVARDPAALPATLFGIRAASLLSDQSHATARARLSGLLIGAELAAARAWWDNREVVLIGADTLTQNYAIALAHLGGCSRSSDAPEMTLRGLTQAHDILSQFAL